MGGLFAASAMLIALSRKYFDNYGIFAVIWQCFCYSQLRASFECFRILSHSYCCSYDYNALLLSSFKKCE